MCKLRHLSSVHGILKSVGAQEQLVCEKRISGSSSATAAGWSNDVIPRIAIQLLQRRWLRFCTADDTFWWLLKRFFLQIKYHGKLERRQCGRIIKCQWKLGFRFVCLLWTCVCPVVWNWVNYASSTEWVKILILDKWSLSNRHITSVRPQDGRRRAEPSDVRRGQGRISGIIMLTSDPAADFLRPLHLYVC